MAGNLNLAVLISGRGSNLKALIQACKNPDFPARIDIVVSSRADASGLRHASEAGLEHAVVARGLYSDREAFERALNNALRERQINLICLAGFMHILSRDFIAAWEGRIINIHPSLLPRHKGLDPHASVLESADTKSGCTVHLVTPEMDAGPVIVQREVPVYEDDTRQTLAARVLEQEHIAYPEAVRRIAGGGIKPHDLLDANSRSDYN